jgi:hypothetical protein
VLDVVSQKQAKFAPHPPYSPDLALSDFFLFGYLKGETRDSFLQASDELLNAVRGLLHDISLQMLRNVFHEWINCCEQVVATEGDYIEQIIHVHFFFPAIPLNRRVTTLDAGHPVLLLVRYF